MNKMHVRPTLDDMPMGRASCISMRLSTFTLQTGEDGMTFLKEFIRLF